MSNYLQEIEAEYSRVRGKTSMLSPIDWNLADAWEQKGIPLRIVLKAMGETKQNFDAQKQLGTINTLRYFEPEVNKQYAEWLSTQVGKNDDNNMNKNSVGNLALTDEYSEFLEENLIAGFDSENLTEFTLSDSLSIAVKNTRRELIILANDIKQKQLPIDDIEARLAAIAADFNLALVADITDDKRAEIIKQAKFEHANYKLTDELLQKIVIRKLYQKYGLPQLTLFAF